MLVSVLCDPVWDQVNDGILDIYAINVNLGAMALCTGVPFYCGVAGKNVIYLIASYDADIANPVLCQTVNQWAWL